MPRISATIDDKTLQDVAALATKDKRSFSEMVYLLLQQAVKEKNRPRKGAKQDN